MGQVAAGLAELDQGLEPLATLDDVFFRQNGLIEPKFFHQGPLFGLADFHAQGLDLLACRNWFTGQIGLDFGHVGVWRGTRLDQRFGVGFGF